jgi:hypothetical protein
LDYTETHDLANLTNYGEFLEKFPPMHEVEISENTSWSCAHGIERWRSDCGCSIAQSQKWNQAWRAPLRNALDWLRDTINLLYENKAREFVNDPWIARDDYIQVLLNRHPANFDAFLGRQAHRILNEGEKTTLLKLLELQRHMMYMYTSCGWFFDDIGGIEAVQVLQYAGRALQLAHQLFGKDFEEPFLLRLEQAQSNILERGDGRKIYNSFVKPAMVDLTNMAAHYAVSSLFEIYENSAEIYCYQVDSEDYHSVQSDHAKLALGRARVKSNITYDSKVFMWGVLYFGNQNLNCGVREFRSEADYASMVSDVMEAFAAKDLAKTRAAIDKHFGGSLYSLKSLFGDQQRQIFNQILEATMGDIEATHREVYQKNATLMKFLAEFKMPLPKALAASAEFVLNVDLKRAIQADEPDLKNILDVFEEAKSCRVHLDTAGLGYLIEGAIEKVMSRLRVNPRDTELIRKLEAAMELVSRLPFELNLWRIQNIFYDVVRRDGVDRSLYRRLGERLRVRVEPALVQ